MVKDLINKDPFFENVAKIIEQARKFVGRTADSTMTISYFEIGRMIVEKEQDGNTRAKYGTKLIENLAAYLQTKFQKGFSAATLKNARQFYIIYRPKIRQTMFSQLQKGDELQKSQTMFSELANTKSFNLSWSHYLVLMRVENENARKFYEIEAINNQWNVRFLERQVGSSLYERLALSKDKDGVMKLAKDGQVIKKPNDIIKDPLVLEFLGLQEYPQYSESDLENAIIDKMQNFLLELGKGFLFEARQKRFTFDNDHFFVDLVFYNRLLKCYVLIDLKTAKLKHQDLGQMQMYVNYFDRHIKSKDENKTIGILLCENKSDLMVELTLPKNNNIFANQYSLYLPDKNLLQSKLAEWIEEFENEKQ
jgi:predicted nuclease of restriction endonuclease-like (RecB) superfamily